MLQKVTDVRQGSAAVEYLSLVGKRIEQIHHDVPQLTAMGTKMAELLLAGGNLYAPDVAKFWPSEFGGRAGGFMGIRSGAKVHESEKNVAYFALPHPRNWDARKDDTLQKLINGKAQLFVIGRPEELEGVAPLARFAGITGGAEPDAGLHAHQSHKPLASLREFDQFVRGWITAGELCAACTRAGKMPIMWMSVWLEGAFVRNAHFVTHNNLREPWNTPFFHDGHYVPPLAPGHVGNEFLAELRKIHSRLLEQSELLGTAGQWIADAKRNGRRVWTVAVGHSYPALLDLAAKNDYPLEWSGSISDLSKGISADLGKGDVALHLGYAPVDADDVKAICNRGVKLIHTSPYGKSFTPIDHPNFLYFDLPWRPADATVDVPGYSVRILPMSSSAQTMALFAMLAEFAVRME
jgi:hypothetical protein